MVVLVDRSLWDILIGPAMCGLRPQYNARLHWPKEEIAKGLVVSCFSRNIHPLALKFVKSRMTTILEMSLFQPMSLDLGDAVELFPILRKAIALMRNFIGKAMRIFIQ